MEDNSIGIRNKRLDADPSESSSIPPSVELSEGGDGRGSVSDFSEPVAASQRRFGYL
jgi:hypothetical protein